MESTDANRNTALRRALLGDENHGYGMEGLRRRHGEQVTIFVMMSNDYLMTLQVDLLDTVDSVKAMIEKEDGMRFERRYRLVFGGTYLEDDRTLASYKIQKESTLYLRGILRGGTAPEVLRGSGTPAQQQKRCSDYCRKVILFVMTMAAAYKVSASESLSIGKIAIMIAVAAVIIADAAFSAQVALARKWGSTLAYLSVPWPIYLSGFLLVLASYLLLISFNKNYGYAIIPLPLPVIAAFVHHRMRQQRTNDEIDKAVDTEKADEDVLRSDNNDEIKIQNNNNDEIGADDNSDDKDVQYFDGIFETSCNFVNCGGLLTMVFGRYMVGPLNPVGFFFFFIIVLGLYLMMITTVRSVVLTPHAMYLEILLKVLVGITIVTVVLANKGSDC